MWTPGAGRSVLTHRLNKRPRQACFGQRQWVGVWLPVSLGARRLASWKCPDCSLDNSLHKSPAATARASHVFRCDSLARQRCINSCPCCSVAQWYLCNTMDCNTPGFPVLHRIPEFAQTHVHWVNDAIQSSLPLSPPSPSDFNLLFQWVGSSH